MKLNIASNKATGTAVEGSQQFSMAMNAKAFHTLSSTLYKDKYGAIIREICSNAYDAHIMVGIPERPFSLVFPDRIDSELIIRDFGPGISPDDMTSVYCRFFESTKDNENDSVGAFGLGSKTPFSYTDSFTVTSIYKGVKRIYTAFKDEGLPNLKLMMESDTDEESGLEVSIPIDRRDFSSFESAVLRELRFFAVKPESNRTWDWAGREVAMDFGTVQFYKTNANVMRGFFVQIGPVGYRIDREMIQEYCEHNDVELSGMAKHLLSMSSERKKYNTPTHSAMLNMPIGTVEVQPSREGLHYTNETCSNILTTIDDASKVVAGEMTQRLDDAYALGGKAFVDMIHGLPEFLRTSLVHGGDFERKYAPFIMDTNGHLNVSWDTTIVPNEKVSMGRIVRRGRKNNDHTSVCFMNYEATQIKNYSRIKVQKSRGMDLFNGDTVYFKDEAYAYKSRIREDDGTDTVSMFIEVDPSLNVDTLLAYFEQYVTIKRVSELPKKSRTSSGSTTNGLVRSWFNLGLFLKHTHVCNVEEYDTLYKMGCVSSFNNNVNDIEEPTVVVRTMKNRIEFDDGTHFTDQIRLAAMLVEAGYNVIAIPKNKTYKNDNICEINELTDDHYKALRDLLDQANNSQILDTAVLFASSFNESVKDAQKRDGWLKPDTYETYAINIAALEAAQESFTPMAMIRDRLDMELAKTVSGATDVQVTFDTVDELFEAVKDITGIAIVPSDLRKAFLDDLSFKQALYDMVNTGNWVLNTVTMGFAHDTIKAPFEIDISEWLLNHIRGLD